MHDERKSFLPISRHDVAGVGRILTRNLWNSPEKFFGFLGFTKKYRERETQHNRRGGVVIVLVLGVWVCVVRGEEERKSELRESDSGEKR